VQAGDFFVELLGQTIDADLVGLAVGPEVQLLKALIGSPHEIEVLNPTCLADLLISRGEAVAHHEVRVAGGATEVHEAAFQSKKNCPHLPFGGI